MKKKILIVTYHDGINYGAFLQVFSLQEFLKKNNYDVQILNYKSLKHTILEYYYLLKTKNIFLFYNTIIKISKFKKLQKKSLNLTKRYFKIPLNNKLSFDYVIYGSDEIWNFNNDLIGLNLIYFGDKIQGKKISYAPSFGNINSIENIPTSIIKLIKEFKISVRDINSYNIISNNLNVKPEIVLDPTFLIKEHLSGHTSCVDIPHKYILIYMTQQLNKKRCDEIIEFASARDLKIVSVGYYHKIADINLINTDPIDFISLLKNSEIILTNMFHGFIISLQYQKNVHLFFDEYRKNKLGFYLQYFNLNYLVISNNETIEESILTKKIDYIKFNSFIDKKLNISKNFLINNLI
jgi:hypothetical protein